MKASLAARLLERREVLITYLKQCLTIEDWHGVQDAASDIREVDAALPLAKALDTPLVERLKAGAKRRR